MNKVILRDWSVVARPPQNPYAAPETIKLSLHGKVYNSDKFEDGDEITTSHFVKVNDSGRLITTSSGSVYYLWNPSEDYISWVEKNLPELWEKWDHTSLITKYDE